MKRHGSLTVIPDIVNRESSSLRFRLGNDPTCGFPLKIAGMTEGGGHDREAQEGQHDLKVTALQQE